MNNRPVDRSNSGIQSQLLHINNNNNMVTPNVIVEWLTILLRIREVSGSNLGPETSYPD
jgi:hypothetical protein